MTTNREESPQTIRNTAVQHAIASGLAGSVTGLIAEATAIEEYLTGGDSKDGSTDQAKTIEKQRDEIVRLRNQQAQSANTIRQLRQNNRNLNSITQQRKKEIEVYRANNSRLREENDLLLRNAAAQADSRLVRDGVVNSHDGKDADSGRNEDADSVKGEDAGEGFSISVADGIDPRSLSDNAAADVLEGMMRRVDEPKVKTTDSMDEMMQRVVDGIERAIANRVPENAPTPEDSATKPDKQDDADAAPAPSLFSMMDAVMSFLTHDPATCPNPECVAEREKAENPEDQGDWVYEIGEQYKPGVFIPEGTAYFYSQSAKQEHPYFVPSVEDGITVHESGLFYEAVKTRP